MIGNTIEYYAHDDDEQNTKHGIYTGKVVDAYTNITGSISGKSESLFGFGEGKVSGSTKSKRMYKVEYCDESDIHKIWFKYIDIQHSQLRKIISFANQPNQETNEEKIITE